ncbi:MAG TPA: 3D-(3,5/4)-trihydroxycyclohexane-1,2-dione acylhydrolase (decyclizing) [Hyphomicrobiaceae bacterium]|nr:3D-(3,5/4)-trihydroxycyclohexane-1,2-dione acylhydrolase (decyclizing) [Hyphomicrobiaceae bacterium]
MTIRLTMAQALVRYLTAQNTEIDGKLLPLFAGVWAIFGHGNVAGLGEALAEARDKLPTYRAHNEQAMAHAAIAFAKASGRRRVMACTTSIGPGATNMVTAAAVAHVNRLPVLLLPGDVFANRRPDPVLQQIEDFKDGTVSANDCFRPVSRYFDRIMRPEQIINALPRSLGVLTDPAECGPVVLAVCQDVQAEAYDYPKSFFESRVWIPRRPQPDIAELERAIKTLQAATAPMIIAGGGVHYAQATRALRRFAETHGVPVSETQAGKSALPHNHPLNMGAIGVTGSSAANTLAGKADVILAIGTRLQDFTTGSRALFKNPAPVILGINAQAFDAGKHGSVPMVCDALAGLEALDRGLREWKVPQAWIDSAHQLRAQWLTIAGQATAATNALPSDAQVIGAVQRSSRASDIIVCAAGGLPGELHKLWQASEPGCYHLEYGYSCMGYEIAGGLGVKMASPDREVIVMVGDGSYLMMHSEIATSIMLGLKLTIVVLDNGGFGCINRLQVATGGEPFNNLFESSKHQTLPRVDFAKSAEGLGAASRRVNSIAELETALAEARNGLRTTVIVIDTDASQSTTAGGHWWDVPVPEVSSRAEVNEARASYLEARKQQSLGD